MPPRDYFFQPDETASGIESIQQGIGTGWEAMQKVKKASQDDEKRQMEIDLLLGKAGYSKAGSPVPIATAPPPSGSISPSSPPPTAPPQPALNIITSPGRAEQSTPTRPLWMNDPSVAPKADPGASAPPVATPGGPAPSSPLQPGGIDSSAAGKPGNASGTTSSDQGQGAAPSFGQKIGRMLGTVLNGGYGGYQGPQYTKTGPSEEETLLGKRDADAAAIAAGVQTGETGREDSRNKTLIEIEKMRAAQEHERNTMYNRGIQSEQIKALQFQVQDAERQVADAERIANTPPAQLSASLGMQGSKDPTGDAARMIQDAKINVDRLRAEALQARKDLADQVQTIIPRSIHQPTIVSPADKLKALDDTWKQDSALIAPEHLTEAHAMYLKERERLKALAVASGLRSR